MQGKTVVVTGASSGIGLETARALHPGGVASNFGASGSWLFKYGSKLVRPFLLTPEQGAHTSVFLASSPDIAGVTGEYPKGTCSPCGSLAYFVKCKATSPSRRARDDASARELWELSERLCGVTWS